MYIPQSNTIQPDGMYEEMYLAIRNQTKSKQYAVNFMFSHRKFSLL